jgi:Xaa-Pro aminopeptidase
MKSSQTALTLDRMAQLQDFLSNHEADAIIVPQADRFQSEYTSFCDERLAWLTGFTGTNGLALVLRNRVLLLTDGRYSLQAQEETEGTHIEVLPIASLEDIIQNTLHSRQTVLFDPWLHTPHSLKSWFHLSEKVGFHLKALDKNPIDKLWKNRPPKPNGKLWPHGLEWAGEDALSKQKKIINFLHEQGLAAFLFQSPESISWALNIRGSDGRYTPIAHMFAFMRLDGNIYVYTDLSKVSHDVRQHCGNHVFWHEEEELLKGLSLLTNGRVLVDHQYVPQKVIHTLIDLGCQVQLGQDPCIALKAVKNTTEITGAYACHKRDAVALVNFLSWLESSILRGEKITEMEAAHQTLFFRKQQEHFFSNSFAPISCTGPHGALVHYAPSIETDKVIDGDHLYLIDSGGQYFDGTTDVTRTVCFSEPNDEQKDRFTRVLKGHIAVATAIFPKGTRGHALDGLARQYLWQAGLDYEHGTGHGVGSFLGVHEGPQNIGKSTQTAPLKPGMILSNEPGYYKAKEYGIRIENLVVVVQKIDEGERQFFGFDTLTLVPIDRKLMERSMLTPSEISWIDSYHHRIWKTLSPLISGHAYEWLEKETLPFT